MAKHRKPREFTKSHKVILTALGVGTIMGASAAVANAAPVYNPDWSALRDCESGSRNADGTIIPGSARADAHNPNDPSWGYYQFMTASWLWAGGGKYAPRADGATLEQQTEIANNLLNLQGPNAWFHCSNDPKLVPGWEYAGEGNYFGVPSNPAPAPEPAPAIVRAEVIRPAQGTFTSGYGARWGTQHHGIDIANSVGTPIYAVANGEVISAGPASGFGNWVRIRHDSGNVTVYGHMNAVYVSVGQRVSVGDHIASMASEGDSTGSHLHFEVWMGGTRESGAWSQDPVVWLQNNGVSLDWGVDPLADLHVPAPPPPPAPAPDPVPSPAPAPSVTVSGSINGTVTEVRGDLAASYQIGDGDTLTKIAVTFGVSVDGIVDLNPKITNADLIFSGDSIKLLP